MVDSGKEVHCPRCKSPVPVFQGIEYDPTATAPARPMPRLAPPPEAENPFRDLADDARRKGRGPEPARPDRKSVPPREADAITVPLPVRTEKRTRPTPPPAEAEDALDVEIVGDDDTTVKIPKPPGKGRRPGPDDYEEEDDGRELPRRARDEELEKARTGLNLVYIATCVGLGAVAALMAGTLIAGIMSVCGAPRAGALVLALFAAAGGLTGLGSGIVALVGQIFCCLSPARQGARTLATVAVACGVGGALLIILASILSYAGAGAAGVIFMVLAAVLGLAHSFLFLFYLRAMAFVVKAKWVAESIRNYLIAVAITTVAYPVLAFLIILIGGAAGAAATVSAAGKAASPAALVAGLGITVLIVVLLGAGVSIALFVWFEKNLLELIDTIDARMKRRSYYGTPWWITLLGASAALILLNLVLGFILWVMGPSAAPAKEESAPPPPSLDLPPPPVIPRCPRAMRKRPSEPEA
jgi:hypothetical protein